MPHGLTSGGKVSSKPNVQSLERVCYHVKGRVGPGQEPWLTGGKQVTSGVDSAGLRRLRRLSPTPGHWNRGGALFLIVDLTRSMLDSQSGTTAEDRVD